MFQHLGIWVSVANDSDEVPDRSFRVVCGFYAYFRSGEILRNHYVVILGLRAPAFPEGYAA